MATESGLLVNSHFLHSAGHFICTILDVPFDMTRLHSHRAKWAWNWDSGTPGLNQSSNSQRISLVDMGVFGSGANLGRITGKGLTIFVIEAGGQTLTILFLSVRLALGQWGWWCKTCGRVMRDGRWSLNKTVTNMYSPSMLSLASQRIVLTRNIPMAEYMLNWH